MINYKIIEVYPEHHSIVVRFYSDVVTEAILATQLDADGKILRCRTDYNIDVPVPAPTGEALTQLILAAAPVAWLKAQEAILNPALDTSMASILPLVGAVGSITNTAPTLSEARQRKSRELAEARYAFETGGVLVMGSVISTDRITQATITSAYTSLSQGLAASIDWKAGDGTWVTLGLPEVTAIARAVVSHVQNAFSLERTLSNQVAAATTVNAVELIVWPQ